eukprot:gene1524-909_t
MSTVLVSRAGVDGWVNSSSTYCPSLISSNTLNNRVKIYILKESYLSLSTIEETSLMNFGQTNMSKKGFYGSFCSLLALSMLLLAASSMPIICIHNR